MASVIAELEHAKTWKTMEVLCYLETFKMDSVVDKFRSHHITGRDFLSLTEKDITRHLDIADLHTIKKLCRHISKLRNISQADCNARLIVDCVVKVFYFSKEAIFKVSLADTLMLKDLLVDCLQYYQIENVNWCFEV
eukprot:TRINITY_DN9332_c0_g2_i1.p1 TRINITY_DN9332_c0_g2~~TRINITY_DN9332_c0_g2_i1.p1  ORF type:complete len:137 (+),score=13.61 TRINITY_DN9332_c0_g2_i1:141-551(+)